MKTGGTQAHVYMCADISAYLYICTYADVHARQAPRKKRYTSSYTCNYMLLYAYIYIHIHMSIYMYIYVYP